MSSEAAFLRVLKRRPDDRVTCLVYADWLDEQGQADKAEFLRLQRQVADMTHGTRGLITRSGRLYRLGRKLPGEWLAVVSRPRLAGTAWSGRDSHAAFCVWRYLPGGVLNYTSPSGTYQNGTWRQLGNRVIMETNRHYADYEGTVAGDRIIGTARNIGRSKWRWDVTLTTDPELCDPDDPDTTVYDDHVRRRRRSARRTSA